MKPTPGKPMKPEDCFYHVHPNDRERVGERLNEAVERKIPFEAEFRALLESGDARWMNGYGRVTETGREGKAKKMSGVMFDITPRKQAEIALHKSEEQLRLILESTKDYAIITYDLKGFITRWNTRAERIFGYTEKEAVGRYGAFLFTPEDQAENVHAQEMKIALEKGRAEDERWHVRKNGARFYASGVMQPLKDGETEGFVKIARDQTERIKAETALREKDTLQKLVTAQEDERKRIARDLHDELGQQLTALRMKLDAIKNNQQDAVLLNQLNEIQNIARSIDDGVDFLAWELRPSSLDHLGLFAALDNYIKQWSHYSDVKAALTVSNLKRERFLREVETCLYRIAQEALNNTHKHAVATIAEVVLERRDDLLILVIEDNGRGFNPKRKINKPQGMGLVGMKERVALVGGTIEIESAPKKGTTIYELVSNGFECVPFRYNLEQDSDAELESSKKCFNCGTKYFNLANNEFCSSYCYLQHKAKLVAEKFPEISEEEVLNRIQESKCVICDNYFHSTKFTAVFCSKECQKHFNKVSNLAV